MKKVRNKIHSVSIKYHQNCVFFLVHGLFLLTGCDQMNAIKYGFHRLYLRCAYDEDYQIAALEHIERREIDALEK